MLEKLKPLRDCVLVQLVKDTEEKTAGGVYLPSNAKDDDRPQVGRVLAVGAGKVASDGTVIQMQIKKDDLVFFSKFSGTDAGKEMRVLREDEVLGVFEK